MKPLLPLVVFLLTSACSIFRPAPPAGSAAPVHVVVVGTTDVHGWFAGHLETPPGGGEGAVWGGLPAFSTYVETLRAQHPGAVVLVDGGDMWQGTLESNMFEGEAVVLGYNAIGYAGVAVGNHEFDYGPAGPAAIARTAAEDELGAIKHNAAIADFPFLSANMTEKASQRTPAWAKRYALVRAGGVSVAIIGLSTPDTPQVTMASNVVNLQFTDAVEATIAAARDARAEGASAVILAAHIGGRCSDVQDVANVASCEPSQEAMRLLGKLPPGTVDAYFGGHTHAQMRHVINGVPALQGAPYSREFATLDLWIDPGAKRVTRFEMRPHTMICTLVYEGTEQCDPKTAPKGARLVPRVYNGRTIVADRRIGRMIEPYLRQVAAKRDEKVGIRPAAPFTRVPGESTLGNLIADALREYAASDFGMMNSGGIRMDMPARDLTYADIFAVSPFDNYPAVVTLTGAEVREVLRIMSVGSRGIMQVSGLRYTVDAARDMDEPAEQRDRVVSVTLSDGTPLDPQKLYTVAMPDFVASGGDGTEEVMGKLPRERVQISYARPVRDILVEVLARRPQPLQPRLDGRITVLNVPK